MTVTTKLGLGARRKGIPGPTDPGPASGRLRRDRRGRRVTSHESHSGSVVVDSDSGSDAGPGGAPAATVVTVTVNVTVAVNFK